MNRDDRIKAFLERPPDEVLPPGNNRIKKGLCPNGHGEMKREGKRLRCLQCGYLRTEFTTPRE